MRLSYGLLKFHRSWQTAYVQRRGLLTLAIETSCDDTSVAVLEKNGDLSKLHFHEKVTSDNRVYGGVHPIVAVESHERSLAALIQNALQNVPLQRAAIAHLGNTLLVRNSVNAEPRKKPDFVTVTRGPGMRSSLNVGLGIAKGLAVAWQVPLLGVNHMQAHALTPRLVSSLDSEVGPRFPFMSLLVSGGHTMLVHSKALCEHRTLASTSDLAIGDVIDKSARDILPGDLLHAGTNVMYGRLLETFAFPDADYRYVAPVSEKEENLVKETDYGWSITPPLSKADSASRRDLMEYSFSGIGSTVKRIMARNTSMTVEARRVLARETMRVCFEHLTSRLILALNSTEMQDVSTVVVAGGVASNQYLKHILRASLDKRGFEHIKLVFPPPYLCTDNAAMIAWTGMEMWAAGYRTSSDVTALRKWSIDPTAEDGGILGADGWTRSHHPFLK